jgi:hypothetical protein
MKKIIHKPSFAMFSIAALLFVLFLFTPRGKASGEVAKEQPGAGSNFSKMSWTEKETCCKKLLTSTEFRLFTAQLHLFVPISIVALEDQTFYHITNKNKLMAWIDKNLPHTQFKSVAEADIAYKDLERLQKIVIEKFSDIDFRTTSSDIAFVNDFTEKNLEKARSTMQKRNTNGQQHRFDNERICSAIHLLYTPELPTAIVNAVTCELGRKQDRIRYLKREQLYNKAKN